MSICTKMYIYVAIPHFCFHVTSSCFSILALRQDWNVAATAVVASLAPTMWNAVGAASSSARPANAGTVTAPRRLYRMRTMRVHHQSRRRSSTHTLSNSTRVDVGDDPAAACLDIQTFGRFGRDITEVDVRNRFERVNGSRQHDISSSSRRGGLPTTDNNSVAAHVESKVLRDAAHFARGRIHRLEPDNSFRRTLATPVKLDL